MVRVLKKYWSMFASRQRRNSVILLVLMIIGSALETLGVSLVIPLINVIMNTDEMMNNEIVVKVCNFLKLDSANEFIILMLVTLICVFVFKDLYLIFECYLQNRFIFNLQLDVQKRLLNMYLHRPYEYYLNVTSEEVMQSIGSDVTTAFGLMSNMLTFLTETIVSMALIITIIIIDPVMALTVAVVLAFSYGIIYFVVKPILRKEGVEQRENSIEAQKWILQSVSGIKDVRVAQKEDFFLNSYVKGADKSKNAQRKFTVLSSVPRLLVEMTTIAGVLGVIAIMVACGRSLVELAPSLSAFVVAAVRLLPSANRIGVTITSISYQEVQLDKVIENLKEVDSILLKEEVGCDEKIEFKKELVLRNITYKYPSGEDYVLEDASMEIKCGSLVGVVGPSGSGKTTTIDIIIGLLKPEKGELLVDGVNINNNNAWLNDLSYIPQSIFLLDDTIRANVAFGIEEKDIDETQVWRALEDAQLAEFVKSLPNGLDTETGERGVRLSGGQRQRIGIARALYSNPSLLIFDEATAALDNETEAAIMESIEALQGKKTMIIIAHRLNTIKNCDVVYRVEDGKISVAN